MIARYRCARVWTSPQPMTAPFASGPGHADAGRPVRLEDEAHRARRRLGQQLVEQRLGLDAGLGCRGHLLRPELALEPLDHPVAAIDLDLEAVGVGDRRRVGRHDRDDLDVPPVGRVDRCRRAQRDRADGRLDGARSEHLARLVARGRDERQAGGDPGRLRGGLRDDAERLAGRDEPWQPLGPDGEREPAPVARLRPGLALVVERDVAHLRRDRVDELAGQPVGEEPRQQQEPADARPQLRLVAGEHVRLGLRAERRHRVRDARRLEREAPLAAESAAAPRRGSDRARPSPAGAARRARP